MTSALGRFLARSFTVAALSAVAVTGWAADFCCRCKDKKSYEIVANDELTAGLECSLKCKRPTRAKAGKCEAPSSSTAPAAAAQPDAAAGKAGSALLYASEDCSGDGKRVTAAAANLGAAGIAGTRSYWIESGAAAGWEKADYAGRKVELVGAGICVSPGFEIGSIRFQE